MKTKLEQIKDEYAGGDFSQFYPITRLDVDEIARRYARECCKATLENAAKNAVIEQKHCYNWMVDKESITNEENIVIL